MNLLRHRRLIGLLLIAPLLAIPSACTFEPGYGYGYDDGPNIGLGIGYYDSLGVDYGGWGPRYRVGPSRGGARSFREGGGNSNHAYRSAGPSRGMPSIPSGPRGGGGRPGGGVRR
jgi:hypothetical protein